MAYLVQQGVQHTLLQARQTAAWWLAMACSFRGPSSRILWQRWLYTCCIRPSLPYSTAASWLIVALFPGLISKYRSKITKQLRKVNNPPESRLSFLPRSFSVTVYFIASAYPRHDQEILIAYIAQIPFAKVAVSRQQLIHYDILFNIPLTVLPLVLIKMLVLSSLIY